MAPVVQAVGTLVGFSGAVTPAWPAHAVGDIAIALFECAGTEIVTLATPAGFVACPNSPQDAGTFSTGTRLTAFWCRATSTSMAAPTTSNPGNHTVGIIVTVRGAKDTGDLFDTSAGDIRTTVDVTTTWPTVTTTVADCLVLLLATRGDDDATAAWSAITNADLASVTAHADEGHIAGNGGGLLVASGVKAAAGATGTTTATVRSSRNAMLTLAVAPAIGAPATTGTLPVDAGLTAVVGATVRATTGTLAVNAGFVGTVAGTPVTTGQLPLTAGLTAAVTSTVKRTTGTLTVNVGLIGVPVARTSGVLRISTELTAVVGATIKRTTGTLPVDVTLVGYTAPQPPANLVQVRHTVLDVSRVPQVRVHVAAYPQEDDLAAPVGVYPATIAPAETFTDSAGRFFLNLIPSSLFDPPAPYVIRYAGHRHTVTVPDSGPVDLDDLIP